MYGMTCVLLGVAVWLILATVFSLPVSTTHSCIGGIIGMAVVSKGWSAVKWKMIGKVAISWLVAPVASCILSLIIFLIVRSTILRATNSTQRALYSYSPIVGFTVAFNIFLVLYNSESLNLNLSIPMLILVCLGIGVVVSLVLQFAALPFIRNHVMNYVENEKKSSSVTVASTISNGWKQTTQKDGDLIIEMRTPDITSSLLPTTENEALLTEGIKEDAEVAKIHKNAEEFDPRTEKLFTYLQIITAVFNSFAHGANDVSNAVGPLASCISIYRTGDVMQDATVPSFTLVLGGFGIVVGLACLGYKVMAAMGVNMATVTPSRGFTIEIGSAIVVLFGSALSLPLSTTHCKVGSTVGVGVVEGKGGVNWKLVYSIFAGWIFTIIICAVSTGGFFYLTKGLVA